MLNSEEFEKIRKIVAKRTKGDAHILEGLRDEIRGLRGSVRTIQARSSTAVSLVASDGGNNQLEFDPFFIQFVRVVDSYGNQLLVDVVSPTSNPEEISRAQFNEDGSPRTALGFMMTDLGVRSLYELSHMIPKEEDVLLRPETVSPSWVQVYRDLCEWAVLYELIRKRQFGTDTLIVRDGLLRSKVFRGNLFMVWKDRVQESIDRAYKETKRRVFVVGVAKRSKVLHKYLLAILLEQLFSSGSAAYVRVPREMEAKAYVWPEYAKGLESEGDSGEAPKFVLGDMFFARFGKQSKDPIWIVDVFSTQTGFASEIFGYLLADAMDGFPIPYYPASLQKAHEFAHIGGFDFELLEGEVQEAIRNLIPVEKRVFVDEMFLREADLKRR